MEYQSKALRKVKKILGPYADSVRDFHIQWLDGTDPDSLEKSYSFLKGVMSNSQIAQHATILSTPVPELKKRYKMLTGIGLRAEKIATYAHLLGRDTETMGRNYRALRKLGLIDSKIATTAQLLGLNPESIERNYRALIKLGLSNSKIATTAQLLGRDTETVKRNYKALQRLGLSNSKIATYAHLLGRDTETVKRNWKNLRKYLSDDMIKTYAQLLGYSPRTVNASIAYLEKIGIDYLRHPFLIGKRPETLEAKLRWLADVFGSMRAAKSFVQHKPNILVPSVAYYERARPKLLQMAGRY